MLSAGMRRWAGFLGAVGLLLAVGLLGGYGSPGWGASPVWDVARDLAPTWGWAAMFSGAGSLCVVAAVTGRIGWWIIAAPLMLAASCLLIGAWSWGHFVQGAPVAAFALINNYWFLVSQALAVLQAHPFGRRDDRQP